MQKICYTDNADVNLRRSAHNRVSNTCSGDLSGYYGADRNNVSLNQFN